MYYNTRTMRNKRVGINLERIITQIQNSVNIAKTHLNQHVTMEGEIFSLDRQCEYCTIYFK
ncbi:MAG TPA: hypothetical protein VE130_12045, partial [Nitrososphaeraceae archaeon]|nr:hypothetical protein [Nitrososphaeraceae archaeon]